MLPIWYRCSFYWRGHVCGEMIFWPSDCRLIHENAMYIISNLSRNDIHLLSSLHLELFVSDRAINLICVPHRLLHFSPRLFSFMSDTFTVMPLRLFALLFHDITYTYTCMWDPLTLYIHIYINEARDDSFFVRRMQFCSFLLLA